MEGAAEQTPRPKSPPEYAGLYGKRRHLTKLMLLEKEITSLQDELKSLDCIPPSSRCCQEVNEFVVSRADPLLATDQNHHKSNCCWTRIWGKPCFRPKGNCCSGDKNSSSRSKKSSQRKPGSNSHQEQPRRCCCRLESFCCGSGTRKCCGLLAVSCPKPNCCCSCTCSCCGSGCCNLKLCSMGCNGGLKCRPRCTESSNCCCCCCC